MGNSIYSLLGLYEGLDRYCKDSPDKPRGSVQCDICKSLIYYKTMNDVVEHIQTCTTDKK